MNAMLGEEELAALLNEAAATFAVPDPDLKLPAAAPRGHSAWRARLPKVGVAAAAIVVGALVLQSGGGGGKPSSTIGSSKSPAGLAVPGGADANGGTTGGTTGGVPGTTRLSPGSARRPLAGVGPQAAPQMAPDAVAGVSGATAAQAAAPAAVPEGDNARIVKTGTLALAVDDGKVTATVARLQQIVAAARGYVADSTTEESGDHPSASLILRVPVDAFERVVQQVRGLKVKVTSAQTGGKDITADYADAQAQIQSLRAARSRYLAILAGARTIGETLTVQQRVDDVQQQIDRLEGRRRVLADQSDLATLTVSINEKHDDILIAKEPSGWSKAWHDAKHGFTSGVQGMLAGSGRTLLVLVVAIGLLLLGRSGWRLARRRMV